MKSSLLILSAFLLFAPGGPWTLTRDKHEIKTYIGAPNGTGLRPTRSIMTIVETPEQAVAAIVDFDQYEDWVPYCSDGKLLEKQNDSTYYFTQLLDMPLIKNRDIVIKSIIHHRISGGYEIEMIIAPTYIPVDPDAIRIEHFTAFYSIYKDEITGKTIVALDNEVDPGGYVPTFAVNWANRSAPHEVFTNLKAHISKY